MVWKSGIDYRVKMRQISKNNFKTNIHDTLLRVLSEENLMIILIYPT